MILFPEGQSAAKIEAIHHSFRYAAECAQARATETGKWFRVFFAYGIACIAFADDPYYGEHLAYVTPRREAQ